MIAGPESPARTAPMTGRPVSTSIAIPTKVLTTARPSVPASMHRRAFSATSVWLGESLVKRGFRVARRQTSTTRADMIGSFPKMRPPSSTLGHEMLISMASTGESSKRRASASYSPREAPAMLAKNRVSPKSSSGRDPIDDPATARILEADGVEHPAGGLVHAVGRIAEARLEGRALEADGARVAVAEPFDPGVLLAEAHAPGEQDDRRSEGEAAEVHGEARARFGELSRGSSGA